MAIVAARIEDNARFGILLMLAAWGLFAFVDVSAKQLVTSGLPVLMLGFFRYAVHFAVSIAVILKGGAQWDRFQTAHPWQLISRALLLAFTTLSNFYVLNFLPLTITSAILFASPVIVCFLSVTLLKEQVGPWRWFAILLGFVGVLIVIRPFGETFHPAMLLCVAQSTALALYSLMTRKLSGIVSTDTMQFYMGATGTALTAPLAYWAWQSPSSGTEWLLLIGLGLGGWAGHQFLTNAHRFATANTLMPFTYSFLIYTSVFSYFIFDHIPAFWTLSGASVVMLSGLIIWKREQRT
ncbi:MAG: DMT family transporter [Aliishimia sp.]